MPAFNQQILLVVNEIPLGKVASYGQIAELAGISRAARLVGGVLKKLPQETSIPWHRVVNSQGKISLPASSPAHLSQKIRLEKEGITFLNGKINMKLYRWSP